MKYKIADILDINGEKSVEWCLVKSSKIFTVHDAKI